MAVRYPVVPNNISVHLGSPDESAKDIMIKQKQEDDAPDTKPAEMVYARDQLLAVCLTHYSFSFVTTYILYR